MTFVWAFIAFSVLLLGFMVERNLRALDKRHSDRLFALQERLEVYRNYNKLAAVRRGEAQEALTKLRKELADEEAEMRRLTAYLAEPAASADGENGGFERFYVFDRIVGRSGTIWHIAVEARDNVPWTGVKNYVIVADSAEDARKRVQDRHPAMSGFAVGPAIPFPLAPQQEQMRKRA